MPDTCPDCGSALDSLDLPCPECAAVAEGLVGVPWVTELLAGSSGEDTDEPEGTQLVHQFAKTFRTRYVLRPATGAFLDEINGWMAAEPGLTRVAPTIHRDDAGVPVGVTLTCLSTSESADGIFRFHRIVLPRRPFDRRGDLGAALNHWGDLHPDLAQVGHTAMSMGGEPVECWILSYGSRTSPTAHLDVHPIRAPRIPLRNRVVGAVMAVLLVSGLLAAVIAPLAPRAWVDPIAFPLGTLSTAAAYAVLRRAAAQHASSKRRRR